MSDNDIVPGKFFAFTKVVTTTEYHTLVLDADDEEAARREAEKRFSQYLEGEADRPEAQLMTVRKELNVKVAPMRKKHIGDQQ